MIRYGMFNKINKIVITCNLFYKYLHFKNHTAHGFGSALHFIEKPDHQSRAACTEGIGILRSCKTST